MDYLLEVNQLKTYFHTFRGVVRAVDDISFNIKPGEILGIVGESGGGKSVTGFSIIRLIDSPGKIEAGQILFDGEDLLQKSEREMNQIRGKDISMIFQDPMTSLNPVYTVERQIVETLKLHTNLQGEQLTQRAIELLSMVGIPEPAKRLKAYPHQFSGGMRQRVVIAIALASHPKLIIADEPTTALDVTIQAQILRLMAELVKKEDTTLILITHDLAVVSEMADRIIVMYCGRIVEEGRTMDIIERHAHPYTEGLLQSIPSGYQGSKYLNSIKGVVPNMYDLPEGCYFSPRCKYATERCLREYPDMVQIDGEHRAACFHPVRGV